MIELVIAERNKRGEPTGKIRSQTFNKGASAAIWYDRQQGHNIERELELAEKNVPIIPHKRG
jgi:hypothetical protein